MFTYFNNEFEASTAQVDLNHGKQHTIIKMKQWKLYCFCTILVSMDESDYYQNIAIFTYSRQKQSSVQPSNYSRQEQVTKYNSQSGCLAVSTCGGGDQLQTATNNHLWLSNNVNTPFQAMSLFNN